MTPKAESSLVHFHAARRSRPFLGVARVDQACLDPLPSPRGAVDVPVGSGKAVTGCRDLACGSVLQTVAMGLGLESGV